MNKIFPIIKYLIGWPLSLIALLFIFQIIFINGSKTLSQIGSINFLYLTISIFLFIIYFLLRSKLWIFILGEKGKDFTFKQSTYAWLMSELKRYVPGSIWAFTSRTTAFENKALSKKEVLVLLAHESLVISGAAYIFSLFYILYLNTNSNLNLAAILFGIFIIVTYVFTGKFIFLFKKYEKIYKFLYLLFPQDTLLNNFKILGTGILTFFIFGLASYFSAISITYIDIRQILIVSSLFTFSYFLGYISLITPMGLGVREGTVAFGLISFTSASIAAVASIYTRIISIFAELLVILLTFASIKIKNKYLIQIEKYIANHKVELLLIMFVAIYIAYFTIASFLRYTNFYTGRFDLGNMDQTVWNTIHGRIFQLTDPDGVNTISRLSVHADFILILISPLYLIWSTPKMLLLLQTIVLGFGAFFVYLISKEVLKHKNISLIFASSFLLTPAIQYTNLYDFHAVTLATTFLLGTFYYYLKKKYYLFIIFGILAGLCKEELWAVIGVFGLFIAVRSYFENKRKIIWKDFSLGLIIFYIGGITTYLLISKIIPTVKGSDHFALNYYADFGNSTGEIVKNILLNPVKLFSTIFEKSRLIFLNQIFLPVGYLSFVAPVFLLFAMPDLLIDLLSNNAQLHQIYYQYTAAITPFIFVSAIFGAKLILQKFKFIKLEHIMLYLLITTLWSAYITGPLPGSKKPNTDMFAKQMSNASEISRFLTSIPKKYSIAATNNLGSHLSRRQNIYNIPLGLDRADVVVFLIDHGFSQQSIQEQKDMVEKYKLDKNYELIYETKDFAAFKKPHVVLNIKM